MTSTTDPTAFSDGHFELRLIPMQSPAGHQALRLSVASRDAESDDDAVDVHLNPLQVDQLAKQLDKWLQIAIDKAAAA